MPSGLQPGTKAPAFALPRDGGGKISLADFAGRKLVLYFYPRADTPGCTKEAIDFNRLKAAFGKIGTEIIGVSADPVEAQDKFKAKHKLGQVLDSRAKCNRALHEPDLHVFAKLFENCLKRSLEAKAFSGREIGGDDDVLDFLVGHFVDVDLTRQPAS
jgi:peroxiredoxin